jgi:hypothetical protein
MKSKAGVVLRAGFAVVFFMGIFAGAYATTGVSAADRGRDRCKHDCEDHYKRRKDECRHFKGHERHRCEDEAKHDRNRCKDRCR